MDSEFPNPGEEFDLIDEEEYEVLREIEESERKKKVASQNVENLQEKSKEKDESNISISNVHKELNVPSTSTSRPTIIYSKRLEPNNLPFQNLKEKSKTQVSSTVIQNVYKELNAPSTSSTRASEYNGNIETNNTAKRNCDELFGDISDILDIDNFTDIQTPKRPRWDEPDRVIKAILDNRKKSHEYGRVSVKKKSEETKRDTISVGVPCWNFIAVTRPSDSQRIYVRVKSNKQNEIKPSACSTSNLLSVPYSQLKKEAQEIILQNVKRASCETYNSISREIDEDDELWVDKYRPRSYIELLSDENVNRHLLHWLKLWDKIVFNRKYVPAKKKAPNFTFRNRNFFNEKPVEEVDSKGFPIQRIVLLSGPPGLGKTTLAHLAARHAGYNVVEINASDERNPESFREVLLSSTQMKSVIGNDPRPNCLVLDEIDGAPVPSIDLLLKFVQGKLVPKGKKDKTKGDKPSNACLRPVICICNEPYTPSLRALRAAALIIPVPEVNPARLADRLLEISQKENLKVNSDSLLRLAEVSGCDIRSCLGALQYMGGISFGDNLSSALKDSRKGLFDTWKQILTIPMNKSGILPIRERVQLIFKTVRNGESEKLALGIFHNYPEICNDKFNYIVVCLQWFQFFDEILTIVGSLQAWSVMSYLNHAFITWHLYFARSRNVKLSYPSALYEMNQKLAKSVGILTTVQRCSGRNKLILAVDIAPFLPDLLTPRLRIVSGHLHSSKERDDITRLINILIDFGFTFIQEKKLDGTYDYKLDPDIFEVATFPDCKHHRTLVYAVKQIIVQELEAERVRRAANLIKSKINTTRNRNEISAKETAVTKPVEPESNSNTDNKAPNASSATKLSKTIETEAKEVKYKDFFGRVITVSQHKQKETSEKSATNSRKGLFEENCILYKYKEGFSNAVRRKVTMEKLL